MVEVVGPGDTGVGVRPPDDRAPRERSNHRPSWGTRRVLQAAVFVLPVAAFAALGWAYRWIVDDGFIYLRVVRQITSGNGPVFNAGERVEVFTSPVWLGLLTAADVLTPVRLEWLAVVGGIALSTAGVVLAIAGGRLLVRCYAPDAFLLPFGVIVFMVLIPTWIFQTSGLETGLVFAWLGACFFLLARWATSQSAVPAASAIVLGLGWLVRPELVLFSAVFLVGLLAAEWPRSTWANRFRLVGAAVALPVVYQVFRMGYYGALISNPGIAKEGLTAQWERGWDYIADFAGPYWLWIALVVVAVGGYLPLVAGLYRSRQRRALVVVVMLVVAALLHALYIVRVGGDWMHARLLLPGLFAVLAPVAVIPATRAHAAAVVLAPWVLMSALTLRPPQLDDDASITEQFILKGSGHRFTTDHFGWGKDGQKRVGYTGTGVYQVFSIGGPLREVEVDVADDVDLPVAAIGGIGVVSFAIGPQLHVVDLFGLADPLASHMISTPSLGLFPRKPGHEKPLPTVWLAAILTPTGARPDPSVFADRLNTLIPATTGDEFQEQVAWARAALDCPEISELLDAADAPLTPGRFWRNLVGSPERTRMRIPPDPREAYEKFCGPGLPDQVRELVP